jgi:hypothetical protein
METKLDLDTMTGLLGDVISTYTRAQALADGVLIDAGPLALDAGLTWPVALTAAAWAECVTWTEADSQRQVYQDETGRLCDVLFMAAYAIRRHTDAGQTLLFDLYRVPRDGKATEARRTTLKLLAGPGDAGEPVLTVTLPHED